MARIDLNLAPAPWECAPKGVAPLAPATAALKVSDHRQGHGTSRIVGMPAKYRSILKLEQEMVRQLLQPQDPACGTLFQFNYAIRTSPTDCSDDS